MRLLYPRDRLDEGYRLVYETRAEMWVRRRYGGKAAYFTKNVSLSDNFFGDEFFILRGLTTRNNTSIGLLKLKNQVAC